MARSKIPDPLTRRLLVERELAPAQALKVAEAYLEEERTVEALDFLAKAGARERIEELRRAATEAGDGFLLRAAAAALGETPVRDEWLAVAQAAEAAGKARYAADARRWADRGES